MQTTIAIGSGWVIVPITCLLLVALFSCADSNESIRNAEPDSINSEVAMVLEVTGGGCGHCSVALLERATEMLEWNPRLLIRYCGTCYNIKPVPDSLRSRLIPIRDPRDAVRLNLRTGNALIITKTDGKRSQLDIDPNNVGEVIARLVKKDVLPSSRN